MSYRISQLSPQSTNIRVRVQGRLNEPPENFREMQFWRSWLEFDSEQAADRQGPPSRINWNAVLGLAVMFGISAGFWTGVGLLIARLAG